ncbi:hypothetical protein LNQ03_11395 [Klebsiella pneumoniae subsp. pneumoniae]|nr:hypothetical protein [Klebsiella pneumoniae subsp. pneumoniae]
MEELAVMGIVASARSPASLTPYSRRFDPPLRRAASRCLRRHRRPDFNITLEGNLKKQGIKTIHYVSPSGLGLATKNARFQNRQIHRIWCWPFLPFGKAF